jgi:putative ABC exporter
MIFAALVRADLRGAWNRLRQRRAAGALILAILAGLLIALGGVFVAGVAVAHVGAQLQPGAVEAMLTFAFSALAVVMLVFGFSTVVSVFYADRDLLLLAAAPVPTGPIFLARLLRASWANSLTAAMLLCALWGFGAGSGLHAGFFGAAMLLALAEVVALTSVQVILLALAVRFLPARRIKDGANILAALAATVFYVGWLAFRAPGTGLESRSQTLAEVLRGLAIIGRRMRVFPTSWPAQALADWGSAAATGWLVRTMVLAVTLAAAAFLLFRVTFLPGLSAFLETAPGGRRLGRGLAQAGEALSASSAIVRKDWLTLRRDGRRLVRLLPGAVLAFAYPLLFFRSAHSSGFWVIGFVPWFLAQIFGLPSVAAERRGLHLLRLASVSPLRLLWAKTLASALPVVGLSLIAAVLTIAVQGISSQSVWIVAATLWLAVGFTLISVGAGAIAPRLDVDDPRRSVGLEGVLVALLGALVFGGLSVAGFGVLYVSFALAGRPVDPVAAVWVGLLPAWTAAAAGLMLAAAVLPPAAVLVAGARWLTGKEP